MEPPGPPPVPRPDDRGRGWPGVRPALVAVQLGGLLALGAVLGAVLPRATVLAGLAGGFVAFAVVAASGLARAWWVRRVERHPHWSTHGSDVLTREVVRTGVGLVVVLFVVAPLSLWAALLPTWVLAAVTAGVACALPVGVAVHLRALNPAAAPANRARLWRTAVAGAGIVALVLSLLVALAGLAAWPRAFAWAGTALAALSVTAWVQWRVERSG